MPPQSAREDTVDKKTGDKSKKKKKKSKAAKGSAHTIDPLLEEAMKQAGAERDHLLGAAASFAAMQGHFADRVGFPPVESAAFADFTCQQCDEQFVDTISFVSKGATEGAGARAAREWMSR